MGVFLLPVSLCEELQRMMNSYWWGTNQEHGRGIIWQGWDKLCRKKDIGGLGFINLLCFNVALLGKLGSKLVVKPHSLVSRIIKARYFPRGDFLHATPGHDPSYVRRSILSSQEVLRKGTRWRIGTGQKVSVCSEAWLKNDSNSFSNHSVLWSLYNCLLTLGQDNAKVLDLFKSVIITSCRLQNFSVLFNLSEFAD
ncbi:hypothetical protein Peur_034771 [Populus x canadensis]